MSTMRISLDSGARSRTLYERGDRIDQPRRDGGDVAIAAQQAVVDLELQVTEAMPPAMRAGAEYEALETRVGLIETNRQTSRSDVVGERAGEVDEVIEQHADIELSGAAAQ